MNIEDTNKIKIIPDEVAVRLIEEWEEDIDEESKIKKDTKVLGNNKEKFDPEEYIVKGDKQ